MTLLQKPGCLAKVSLLCHHLLGKNGKEKDS